jgi:amidohydrolase
MEHTLRTDFEWLHAHPELSYQEYETTRYIRARLEAAGIPILPYALETGLVAEIRGAAGGPSVALRADIDALPVAEDTGVCYASKAAGRMHACGHDFHTAVLLEAGRRLWERRASLAGTVRLIFQPAEESSNGALKVLATPALSGVDAIFALHTTPLFAPGTVAVRPGAASASVDRFELTVTGRGTHAAAPEAGVDPIVIAAQIIGLFQTVVSRSISPLHAALVSVTHLSAGSTWNVIPDTAYLEGTVRTHDPADREQIPRRLAAMARGTAEACGAAADFVWHAGPPATANDPGWTAFAAETARAAGLPAAEDPPSMLGEDFAFFQEKVPGVYIHFGIGLTAPNHNPKFCVDEAALEPAAAYSALLAEKALERLAAR